MKELSSMLLLEADPIIKSSPIIMKNEMVLRKMFNVIIENGISVSTATKIIPLVSQIKK